MTILTNARQLAALPLGTIITAIGGGSRGNTAYHAEDGWWICGDEGTWADEALIDLKPEWTELRPLESLERCKTNTAIADATHNGLRIAWNDDDTGNIRNGTVRGWAWDPKGYQVSNNQDPRDHFVRITMDSGADWFRKWSTLANLLESGDAAIGTRNGNLTGRS